MTVAHWPSQRPEHVRAIRQAAQAPPSAVTLPRIPLVVMTGNSCDELNPEGVAAQVRRQHAYWEPRGATHSTIATEPNLPGATRGPRADSWTRCAPRRPKHAAR